MNRLRLIQEELLDGKKQVARTKFHRKVYEDAMAVFGQLAEAEEPADGHQSKGDQPTTSDGQGNDGGSESIKTGPVLSLTVETQDLIQLYNKLVKDKK